MEESVVIIRKLTKVIGGHTILNQIDLEVKPGRIYGIIGHNGSGKSMLFKAIAGYLRPTKGEVIVFGEKIGEKAKFPKHFGALIEHPGFLPQYSGMRNLKLLAAIKNEITDEEIKEAITQVGLDWQDKRPVKKYSLGMKQRLGIAQAIMEKPKLLILDEPMNGLDKKGVKVIRDLLRSLREQGVAILLASHNRDDIVQLSDEVYEMDGGMLSKVYEQESI